MADARMLRCSPRRTFCQARAEQRLAPAAAAGRHAAASLHRRCNPRGMCSPAHPTHPASCATLVSVHWRSAAARASRTGPSGGASGLASAARTPPWFCAQLCAAARAGGGGREVKRRWKGTGGRHAAAGLSSRRCAPTAGRCTQAKQAGQRYAVKCAGTAPASSPGRPGGCSRPPRCHPAAAPRAPPCPSSR